MKRTGPTEPGIIELARKMKKIDRKISKCLLMPKRKKREVSLSKINRLGQNGDILAVPFKVLGNGFLKKKVDVYAVSFSDSALRKIKEAGGNCYPLGDLKEEIKARIVL